MKKLVLSLAAASALAVAAAPAAAQSWDPRYDDRYDRHDRYDRYDRYDGYDRYDRHDRWDRRYDVSDRLRERVERSWRNGRLTRQEYYSLSALVRDLSRVENRYLRDGHLSRWERDDLRRRANYVENRIRRERQDRDWGFYD